MIYKEYGRTGKRASAVGFGGMRFDLSLANEENAKLVAYAFDQGVNFFDTAPGYCKDQSETILGLGLKPLPRDEILISTKGMPMTFDTDAKAEAAVEASLRKLQVEKIDFYHVWCVRKVAHYELAMRPGGQYEGLLRCKERGLIDHIVISTHLQGPSAWQVLSKSEFDGVLLGMNILNFPYRWEAVAKAHEMGLGVVAMNPLAGGLIPQMGDKLDFLCTGAETPTEAALRFTISCPQITVTLNGFTTREHIDTACKVAQNSQPFSAGDIDRIRQHVSEQMNAVCTGCGYCLEHCPVKIPIAAYMQVYNFKQLYGSSDEEMIKQMGVQHEWQLLVDRQAEAGDCTGCRQCEQACTQHLNIVERLEEIAGWEAALRKQQGPQGGEA